MSGIKTSVKLGRIEFTFYSDLFELAQSSDYSVIEPQSVTQEIYHGHQLLHIRKVASDKIRKLRQFAVLLLVNVFISCICSDCCRCRFRCRASSSSSRMRSCKSLFLRSNDFIFPLPKREPTLLARAVTVSVLRILRLPLSCFFLDFAPFTCHDGNNISLWLDRVFLALRSNA